MIEYKQGDILQDDAEALVNTVNCVGAMGRGIAQIAAQAGSMVKLFDLQPDAAKNAKAAAKKGKK